jgi:hypothetical protein
MSRRLLALATALSAAALTAASATAATVTTVMSGLDSPRGLAFGPEGALYVAEAGRGGPAPCAPVARGFNCYGATGAVSRLWRGEQSRVAQGLPSVQNPVTHESTGPHDISFQGRGGAFVTIGWGGDPAARAALGPAGAAFGNVLKLEPSGGWRSVADLSAVEASRNPAGGPVDSNPYGILAEAGDRYVTDAGGNDLLRLSADGSLSVVATFSSVAAPPPFLTAEPVPTAVERGPDGALYVSELTGVPFTDGAAGIYRIGADGTPSLVAAGLKTVTDFTFGSDGSMYVVEYASSPVFFGGPGLLVRIAPNGTRSVVTSALNHPTSVAYGPDGALYVSNNGDGVGTGEVLRVQP